MKSGQINANTPLLQKDPTSFISKNWFRFLTSRILDGVTLALPSPVGVTTATYNASVSSPVIYFNYAGTCTVTLPNPELYQGAFLFMVNYTANAVDSASSDVTGLTGSAGTSLLAATAGKWTILQADGTTWRKLAGN